MTRTVYMPLSREPEVLFGLRLADLLWVLAASVIDLVAWRGLHHWLVTAAAVITVASALGVALAIVRVEDRSLPEWIGRAIRYGLSPRLYLP